MKKIYCMSKSCRKITPRTRYSCSQIEIILKKKLKVFRLKAAILGLLFVNLMMFNCSLLSKTCLNVYRPTYRKLSLPGTSCNTVPDQAKHCPVVPSGAQCCPAVPRSAKHCQTMNVWVKHWMSEVPFKTSNECLK